MWFSLNFPGSKIPPKPELIDFLKKNYKKKMTNSSLKGYEIIEVKEEEEAEQEGRNHFVIPDKRSEAERGGNKKEEKPDDTEKPDMIEI